MAVSWARGAGLACLGLLVACSDEPNFGDDASGGAGVGTGAGSTGGSASGGSASGGSASGGSASGGSSSGGSSSGGAAVGGAPPGGGGAGGNVVAVFCGDGSINGPNEECDDGNMDANDGCTGCVVDCPQDGYKDPVTHHCYFLVGANDWGNRRQECVDTAPGTDAAALSTLPEYDTVTAFLESEGDTHQIWIGGSREGGNQPFVWSNGEPWIYMDDEPPWSGGFPDAGGDCTRINAKGSNDRDMRNDNCGENKPMLCERTPLGS